MHLPLAILSTLTGMGATLLMLVLLLAGSPNSTPAQLSQIKWLMLSVAVVGLIGTVAAIWSMCVHRHGLGAAIGFAPALFVVILFVILWNTQG